MTADDIKALVEQFRDREAKATKGPWTYQENSDAYTHILRSPHAAGTYVVAFPQSSKGKSEDDARFTAMARTEMPNLLDAIPALLSQVETLTLENQRLRVDAEAMRQELKNIANADTVEWDDPTQYEAWAKSRARHTLAQIDKEKPL